MSIVTSLFGSPRDADKSGPKTIHGSIEPDEKPHGGNGLSTSSQNSNEAETAARDNAGNEATNGSAPSNGDEPTIKPRVGTGESDALGEDLEKDLYAEFSTAEFEPADEDPHATADNPDEGDAEAADLAAEPDSGAAKPAGDMDMFDAMAELGDLGDTLEEPAETEEPGGLEEETPSTDFSMGASGQAVAIRAWQSEPELRKDGISGGDGLALFAEFAGYSDNVAENLSALEALITQSRGGFAKLQDDFDQIRRSLVRARDIEADRERLLEESRSLRHTADNALDQVAEKASEIAALNERLRTIGEQNDQRRAIIAQLKEEAADLRRTLATIQNEREEQKSHVAGLTTALDRERSEKAALDKSKADLATKFAKLQQHETDARTRLAEMELQNEKLTKLQRSLSGEQERLRNDLRASHKEKSDQVARVMSLEDEVRQLEAENETLKGRVAADTYALENELELRRSALRISEAKLSDAMAQVAKLEKEYSESETARATSEENQRKLLTELEEEKRRLSEATYRLSDVNLKYMTDLVSFDSQREANRSFQHNIDALIAENRRLSKFESLYSAAESQVRDLRERLRKLSDSVHLMPEGVQAVAEEAAEESKAAADEPETAAEEPTAFAEEPEAVAEEAQAGKAAAPAFKPRRTKRAGGRKGDAAQAAPEDSDED